MPLGDGITFSYGDHIFDPRPLFTVNKEMIKTTANTGLATKYSMTLNGHVLPTGAAGIDSAGLTNVLSGTNVIRDAFDQDFKLLLLQCSTDTPLISGYPKVISVDINHAGDNYIQRADYTINLELASLTGSVSESGGVDCNGTAIGNLSTSGLISLTDNFTVEFLDERLGGNINISDTGSNPVFGTIPSVFSLQRTLSAQGDPLACVNSVYTEPWQIAKNYVSANLGLTPDMTGLSGLMCVSGMSIASNFRSINIDKTEGSVEGSETFIAYTGLNPATEEMDVSAERSSDSPHVSVTINGTVQGLSVIDYNVDGYGCVPTGETKFNNALAAWSGISGSLYARANAVYGTLLSNNRPIGLVSELNLIPLSESIAYNPIVGTVAYGNSYNDRPDNINPYSLTETVSYTNNHATDIFASLTVIGRAGGPLMQSIGTFGPVTASVSIDAIMLPVQGNVSGLSDDQWIPYSGFVDNYEDALLTLPTVDRVYISDHSESWEPNVGHFTLNKTWTLSKTNHILEEE